VGPIGRLGLLRTLPRLYDGSHIKHPSRFAPRWCCHVEFKAGAPVDIMIDGEVVTLECRALDIRPAAVGHLYMKTGLVGVPQRDSLDRQRLAFLLVCAIAHLARHLPGYSQYMTGCSAPSAAGSYFFPARRSRSAELPASMPTALLSSCPITSIYFDPFMLYCAIPQFVRGWELESHFKIPAYGWLMKSLRQRPCAGCPGARITI